MRAIKNIVNSRQSAGAANRSDFGNILLTDQNSAGEITLNPRFVAADQAAFDHVKQPFPKITVMGNHAPRVKRLG